MKKLFCLQILFLFLLIPVVKGESESGKVSVGLQFLSPFLVGLNMTHNVSDTWSVQGIVASNLFNEISQGTKSIIKNPSKLTMSCARIRRRIVDKNRYGILSYVLVGNWNYEGFSDGKPIRIKESEIGFGLGAVIECRPKHPQHGSLPIFFDIELGFNFIKFERFNLNLMGPSMGMRGYYRFG